MKLFVYHCRGEYENRVLDEGYAVMAESVEQVGPALRRHLAAQFAARHPGRPASDFAESVNHLVGTALASLVEVLPAGGVAVADFWSE